MSCPLRVLYICYYPLTEPLVQTQVVAYLSGLAQRGHCIHLLTFETVAHTPAQKRQWRRRLKEQGIIWHSLRYHKRPTLPATVFDVFCGVLTGLRLISRHKLQVVHARSHVPAAMGLLLKRLTGCRLLFDFRGMLAEEYVDAGNWSPDGLPFRITKRMERRSINGSDALVVLTERVRREMFDGEVTRGKQLQVIPCCADQSLIARQSDARERMRPELGVEQRTVLVYAGKCGSWYMQAEMVDFFAVARQEIPGLFFLVLTQSEPSLVEDEFKRHEIAPLDYKIMRVDPAEIGAYLAAADGAISLIRACPSKIASSPTKLGEYWAAGLPVVCNVGVGDVDSMVSEANVGVLLEELNEPTYREAARRFVEFIGDEEARQRCQTAAENYASLEKVGIPRYHELYQSLASELSVSKSALDEIKTGSH